MWHVDAFVAVEYADLCLVVVVAAEVMIVVVGGVVHELGAHGVGEGAEWAAFEVVVESGIFVEELLVFVAETIESEVLLFACSFGVVEGVGDAVRARDATPLRLLDIVHIAVDGQSALV